MTTGSSELVERLYRRLLEAASRWPAADAESLTIGDLYQHLIPYRAVRGELGVLELAQYEDALLRLLSGEGEFVRVLDEEVRRELAAELAAPNPILGIYRDYAGVEVELRGVEYAPPALMPADAVRVAPRAPDVRPESVSASAADRAEVAWVGERSASAASPEPSATTAVTADTAVPVCVSCRQPLPDVEGLLFCPHCGADQSTVPCESCGALIQNAWNFCIRCGSPRPTSPTSA